VSDLLKTLDGVERLVCRWADDWIIVRAGLCAGDAQRHRVPFRLRHVTNRSDRVGHLRPDACPILGHQNLASVVTDVPAGTGKRISASRPSTIGRTVFADALPTTLHLMPLTSVSTFCGP